MKTDNTFNGSYSYYNAQCTNMTIKQCNCNHNLPDDIPAFPLLRKIIKIMPDFSPKLIWVIPLFGRCDIQRTLHVAGYYD